MWRAREPPLSEGTGPVARDRPTTQRAILDLLRGSYIRKNIRKRDDKKKITHKYTNDLNGERKKKQSYTEREIGRRLHSLSSRDQDGRGTKESCWRTHAIHVVRLAGSSLDAGKRRIDSGAEIVAFDSFSFLLCVSPLADSAPYMYRVEDFE